LGKWNQLVKKYGFDKFFHSSLICVVNGEPLNVEKNEVISISKNIPSGEGVESQEIPLNGKSFTLPYPSKARFQRTLVRSNLTNIESGYIYPYSASREISKTSEIFELNNDNGIFIGLFLAEGNVDIKSGYIQITNNDIKIREFVKSWFEKFGIKTSEDIFHTHINNHISSIF
jgi:hypothetical protein